jgi:hypothetical protein
MSLPSNASDSSFAPARPLAERVQERVAAAQAAVTARRRNPDELHALNHVFCEMGRAQRLARRRTGQMPSPIVRQAAQAFRDAPSLPALVLVAAALDETGLLF